LDAVANPGFRQDQSLLAGNAFQLLAELADEDAKILKAVLVTGSRESSRKLVVGKKLAGRLHHLDPRSSS
jgi:hypothetical protein